VCANQEEDEMPSKAVLTGVVVCALTASPALAGLWDDCDFTDERHATIPADGVTTLVIDAGAGSLHVDGVDGLEAIEVDGTACADEKDLLEKIRLETRTAGARATVKTVFPKRFLDHATMRLDLQVKVPARMALEIDDGSGEIEIAHVAAATIKDGSGEIEVNDVDGKLEIEDGSGEIEVRTAGSVRIDDGSGEIEVRKVAGDVTIEDGSGEIHVAHVKGSVIINNDGSGDIEIVDVTRDVRIESDGSGDIDVEEIGGDFIVADDGSGGISHKGVRGTVDIPKK